MDRLRDYFKCYDPRFIAWTFVGLAVLAGASFGGLLFDRGSWVRFVCAALQASTMGTLIVAGVFRMRHLDELQRRIQLESIALAFAVGAAAITGWGYFEVAGAPRVNWGLWIWPFFAALWITALLLTRRRYR
jgi:hypothetical protein